MSKSNKNHLRFNTLWAYNTIQKMENKGLLFIPDISDFTKFVTNIELTHGRHIIQELLELLIDKNELGFEVSEVEGDAVLFYKFGDSPELSSIYEQVEKMFNAFHTHLNIYEQQRTCQCNACKSAINLTVASVPFSVFFNLSAVMTSFFSSNFRLTS